MIVVKFLDIVRRSELPCDDPQFRPIHCEQSYDTYNRKLRKILAKTSWYEGDQLKPLSRWRSKLPGEWIGDKPRQVKVRGMRFSSIMQVPSSKGGQLVKLLARSEPKIAKGSGYQVKLVESSGRNLSKFFSKNLSKSSCHKAWCSVCSGSTKKGPKMCGIKSVVYIGVCELCEADHQKNPENKHKGVYVGQTYRTLAERAK